jgi:hypothetical protein
MTPDVLVLLPGNFPSVLVVRKMRWSFCWWASSGLPTGLWSQTDLGVQYEVQCCRSFLLYNCVDREETLRDPNCGTIEEGYNQEKGVAGSKGFFLPPSERTSRMATLVWALKSSWSQMMWLSPSLLQWAQWPCSLICPFLGKPKKKDPIIEVRGSNHRSSLLPQHTRWVISRFWVKENTQWANFSSPQKHGFMRIVLCNGWMIMNWSKAVTAVKILSMMPKKWELYIWVRQQG